MPQKTHIAPQDAFLLETSSVVLRAYNRWLSNCFCALHVKTHSFDTSWQLLMLINHFLNRIWRQGDHLLRFHAWDHKTSEKRSRKKKSTWCRVNRLPKMGPQLDREESIHGNQRHLSCLVKIFPKTSANIHSSGKTKGRFADVFREDRDDGNPSVDGTLSKSLPVNLWMFTLMRRKKSPWSPKYRVVGVSEVGLSCSSWSDSQQRPISREAHRGLTTPSQLELDLTWAARCSSLWCRGRGWSAPSPGPARGSPSGSCKIITVDFAH